MNIEDFRNYCIELSGVTEEMPFGPEALVFKVGGKIFAITKIDTFKSISLKCDPERAVELREKYSAVQPGYHLNKKHWNTIDIDGSLLDDELYDLIKHSYELVKKTLPKKIRESL